MRLAGRHVASNSLARPYLARSGHISICPRAFSTSPTERQFEFRLSPNPQAKSIAVLGGGITGLASAYNLARTIPNAHITLYESKERLGGWLDSEVMKTDEGDVLFEWGPRTLRSDLTGAGRATAALIAQLDMLEDVVGIPKNSLAASNRFIYYPDHLVRMPGPYPGLDTLSNFVRNIYNFLKEPIFRGVFSGLLAEPTVKQRPQHIDDESVGDFITRRFGSVVAENLLSAVFHGIYAGNIYNLSARTLLPKLWYFERRDPDGSGVLSEFAEAFFQAKSIVSKRDIDFHNTMIGVRDTPVSQLDQVTDFLNLASVYTFKKGLSQLARRLEEALRKFSNVTIRTSSTVNWLKVAPGSKDLLLSVRPTKSSEVAQVLEETHNYVVCSLSPATVFDFFRMSSRVTALEKLQKSHPAKSACENIRNDWVNVMIVNLYYSNPSLIPQKHRGFGYLLPRSIPIEENPERALGVIFASESSGTRGTALRAAPSVLSPPQIERLRNSFRQQTEDAKHNRMVRLAQPITKDPVSPSDTNLDAAEQEFLQKARDSFAQAGQDTAPGTKLTVMLGGHWWSSWSPSDIPTSSQAIHMAKSVLARHMNITEEPLVAKARLAENAIPQYRPGYRKQMATIHDGLLECFDGRLKVAGPPWQGGAGVNDCVRKAREVSLAIREGWDDVTGLESFVGKEQWYVIDKKTGRATVDGVGQSE